MPIFLLTVKDPYHEDWKGYRPGFGEVSKVVVRADSRKEAQKTAKKAINWELLMEGVGRNRRMKAQPDPHPLQHPDITECKELDPNGPDSVIALETIPDWPVPKA